MGKQWKQCQTLFWGGSKITAEGDCSHEIKRCVLFEKEKNYNKPRQHIKKQRHYFAHKGPSSQSYSFSSSHVWMLELDHKESGTLKNWCFWTVVLEMTLWIARRFNQSILKEIGPEYSLEGLMLKLKLQIFGHRLENWLIGKDPDAGKDWGQEKGMTEDEMVGWHHWLNGHEFG